MGSDATAQKGPQERGTGGGVLSPPCRGGDGGLEGQGRGSAGQGATTDRMQVAALGCISIAPWRRVDLTGEGLGRALHSTRARAVVSVGWLGCIVTGPDGRTQLDVGRLELEAWCEGWGLPVVGDEDLAWAGGEG